MRLSMAGVDDGALVVRRARKTWACEGNGSAHPTFAPGCWSTIRPGGRYLECMWTAPAYASGSRHCEECALAFFGEWVRA